MSQTKIYSGSSSVNIQKAASLLKKGGIVSFPTETVYGLGADAFNYEAVCKIFEVKKRPSFDPLIIHVSSKKQAFGLWSEVPKICEILIEKFWPGPLTLVLPKADGVLDLVTSGLPTVAVRMPNHPVALELIRTFDGALAAPSANLFGYTSPTSSRHVWEDLGQSLDMILDGGECSVGVESTVLQINGNSGKILRPGGISSESLSVLIKLTEPDQIFKNQPMSAPGMLESHYAPRTKLVLLDDGEQLCQMTQRTEISGYKREHFDKLGLLCFKNGPEADYPGPVEILSAKGDLKQAASNLFKAIRKLDKMNLDLILAERVPSEGIGLAILDRLKKASADKNI